MPDRPLEELRGKVGESRETVVDLVVEAGKVDEFARAIRADNPAHRDETAARDQGFEAIPAPLTFTRTSYFERYRPDGVDEHLGFDLGLDPRYLVHGEQEYEYERPVTVGDTLAGTTSLTDVSQREGGRGGTLTFVVFKTAFHDEGGDLVLTERNTRIETESAIDDGNESTEAAEGSASNESDDSDASAVGEDGESTRGAKEGPPRESRTPLSAEDVAVGDEGPTVVAEDVDREDFVRYAGASGDFYRIHYDEPYARAAGNPSVFGQGMLTAGFASHMVADWFGLENVRRFRTRFESRLWPNTTVTVTGTVTDKRPVEYHDQRTAADSLVDVEFSAIADDGEVLLTGDATAGLPAGDG